MGRSHFVAGGCVLRVGDGPTDWRSGNLGVGEKRVAERKISGVAHLCFVAADCHSEGLVVSRSQGHESCLLVFVTNKRGGSWLFGRVVERNVFPHGDGIGVGGDHVVAKLGDLVGIDINDVLRRLGEQTCEWIQ